MYTTMKVETLKEELGRRGLPKTGLKGDLLDRLLQAVEGEVYERRQRSLRASHHPLHRMYTNMNVRELKEQLGRRGLRKNGLKEHLLDRLLQDVESRSSSSKNTGSPPPQPATGEKPKLHIRCPCGQKIDVRYDAVYAGQAVWTRCPCGILASPPALALVLASDHYTQTREPHLHSLHPPCHTYPLSPKTDCLATLQARGLRSSCRRRTTQRTLPRTHSE